jgi:gene 25-like lysozyme
MDFRIESNEKEQLEESIIRQLSTLYKTRRGSIPMHRDFGLLWDILAESTPIFQNKFTVEVVTQTEKYVPEVTVDYIEYVDHEGEGIQAIVHVKRR